MPRPAASRKAVFLLLAFAALCAPAHAAPKKAAAPAAAPAIPLLPATFGNWHQTSKAAESSDPKFADAANAPALAEYGLQRFASANYTDPAGDQLALRADQFPDATGAYGAFTFYRQPEMQAASLGAGAGAIGNRVLFWQGRVLVDAEFSQPAAQPSPTAPHSQLPPDKFSDQLRPLLEILPKALGNAAILPALPGYLPADGLQKDTGRYTLGPAAYAASGGALPASLVGFDMGTEAITAQYALGGGRGTLTILNCPTTQLAANRLAAILNAESHSAALATAPSGAISAATFAARRSGTLVAIANGSFPPQTAQTLIDAVNYRAGVTWNHPQGYVSDSYRAARLYLNIFALCGILGSAAILLGLFLGGGRALVRVWQGKPASTMHDAEFISLHLRD